MQYRCIDTNRYLDIYIYLYLIQSHTIPLCFSLLKDFLIIGFIILYYKNQISTEICVYGSPFQVYLSYICEIFSTPVFDNKK